MDDDFENMCPLCVLPFNEQDSLFRPCGCGFRICSWCWHKIVDSAGEAGESTVDTVAKCPNCREPFDVAATLEQQVKNTAIIAMQNKAKPKRKAVPAKQGVVDNVYVDGKSVVMRNVPSDAFFPLVLRRLRDKHLETYQLEIAAAHGTAAETRKAKREAERAAAGGLDDDEDEEDEEDETYAAALVEDSSDEEDDVPTDAAADTPTALAAKTANSTYRAPTANTTATNTAASEANAPLPNPFQATPQPFPFAAVPPCRTKKEIKEVLKSVLLHDHLTAAEDQDLLRLIVERRNDYPYQHVYSTRTERLEHLTPYLVAPTVEQLQQLTGVQNVDLAADLSSASNNGSPMLHGNFYGSGSTTSAAAVANNNNNTNYYGVNTHAPTTTGYPSRAPTLSRFQLQALSRYESDLWSWVEHFLTPPPEEGTADKKSPAAVALTGPTPTTSVTTSAQYFNHTFFDSWVPMDASSRTARRATIAAEALQKPLLPTALAAALNAQKVRGTVPTNKAAVTTTAAAAADDVAEAWDSAASPNSKALVPKTDNGANDDDNDDEEGGITEEEIKQYRLLHAVAAPSLFNVDDAIASMTVEQVVADLPVLTYSVVEQLVATAISAHKVRGGAPSTTIGGFVTASTMAQFVPSAAAAATSAPSTTSSTTSTAVAISSTAAAAATAAHVFPSPVAILSSVLIVLLHRRRQWHRWLTELIAAADTCVRETLHNKNANATDVTSMTLLRHLLPEALRQQQQLFAGINNGAVNPLTGAPIASAASAANTPAGGAKRGILDRNDAATLSTAATAASSSSASPLVASNGYNADGTTLSEHNSNASLSTPTAPKAYLLTFGIAIINYLGLKEGTCLTDADRIKFLRSYGALGRYGTVTDVDIYLQECQLLLNVKPDVKQYRKALQMAAAAEGGVVAEVEHNSTNNNKGGKGKHHAPSAAAAAASADALAAVEPPKERKWPEELQRVMCFRGPFNYAATTSAALAALAAVGDANASPDTEVPVLPCQYYWISLRFGAIAEAVHCVLKGTEELFPSWLGYAAAPSAAGGATEGSNGTNRSPASSPTAAAEGIGFNVSPTRRVVLTPRRTITIGLIPVRYCGSYLKHQPCKKQLCVELHNDVSGKNAILVGSTNPEAIVRMVQKHFFTPYLEAEGYTAAAIEAMVDEGGRNNTIEGTTARSSATPLLIGGRQGSSTCFLLNSLSTGQQATTAATNNQQSSSLNRAASSSTIGGGCGSFSTALVSGAAATAAAGATTGGGAADVKSIVPLHLKGIKAGEISVYGGDLIAPSPLLLTNTSAVMDASITSASTAAGGHNNASANASAGSASDASLMCFDEDPTAQLRLLLQTVTRVFANNGRKKRSVVAAPTKTETATTANTNNKPSLLDDPSIVLTSSTSASTKKEANPAAEAEAAAAATAEHLLGVSAHILNLLLSQDNAGNKAQVASYTSSGGGGACTTATKEAAGTAQQRAISFVTLQLASLASQCVAGAVASSVTANTLTSSSSAAKKRGAATTSQQPKQQDPSAWIGIKALRETLLGTSAAAANTNGTTTTTPSYDPADVQPIDIYDDATIVNTMTIDERRALVLSMLPEIILLMHTHLGALLAQISAAVSDNVLGSLKQAQDTAGRRLRDAAAAKALAIASGKAGNLTVLRNSSAAGASSSLQQLMASLGSSNGDSAIISAGGNAPTGGADGGAASSVFGSALTTSASGANKTGRDPTIATLTAALRFAAIPSASKSITALQTAFVTLTRILQVLRQIADTVSLSATLSQIQAQNQQTQLQDITLGGGASASTDFGGGMVRQGTTTVPAHAPMGSTSSAAAAAAASSVAAVASDPSTSAELLTAKALVQRANFVRVLFASLQLYVQCSLTTELGYDGATNGVGAEKKRKSTAGVVSAKAAASAAVAMANNKIRLALVEQHLRVLNHLPPQVNLTPNTEEREIIVSAAILNNINGIPITAAMLSAVSPIEATTADHLSSHQLQLQSGVTPSSAIAAAITAASSAAPAPHNSRYGSNSHATAAANSAALRSRNAVAQLLNLVHRRVRRSRKQLGNALEMWSSFIPACVVESLEEDVRDDFFYGGAAQILSAVKRAASNRNNKQAGGSEVATTTANEEGLATSARDVVYHAMATLLLPHQFSSATRYWQLCNSIAVAAGTSGVSVGSAAFTPASLLTVGSLAASALTTTSASTASPLVLDPHAATVDSRLYADGLAWLRNIGTRTQGETVLFQQMGSNSSSNSAAAAAAQLLAEQEAAAALAAQQQQQAQQHHSNSHHSSYKEQRSDRANGGYEYSKRPTAAASNNKSSSNGGSNNNTNTVVHSTVTPAATPSRPVNAWGTSSAAVAGSALVANLIATPTPATPPPAVVAPTAVAATPIATPTPATTNAWGAPAKPVAVTAPTPITTAPMALGASPTPSPAPSPIAPSGATSASASTSTSAPANAWAARVQANKGPSAWGAADLPALGSSSGSSFVPPQPKSFAAILGAKK